MTEFASFPDDGGEKRIVYVREVKTADLPEEVRAPHGGLDHLYAIHAENGAVLALVPTGRRRSSSPARTSSRRSACTDRPAARGPFGYSRARAS